MSTRLAERGTRVLDQPRPSTAPLESMRRQSDSLSATARGDDVDHAPARPLMTSDASLVSKDAHSPSSHSASPAGSAARGLVDQRFHETNRFQPRALSSRSLSGSRR